MHRPVEVIPRAPTSRRIRPLVWAVGLALLAMLASFVDAPLAQWFHEKHLPRDVAKLLAIAETFGHGVGIALILLTLVIVDPISRYGWWRMLGASLGSGLAADGVKLLAARIRPCEVEWQTTQHTFAGWMPMLANGYGTQSFPSSHVAAAVGLALALGWRFERGKLWFGFLAALVALQRMAAEAHFLSDALAGAAVAALIAPLFLTPKRESLEIASG